MALRGQLIELTESWNWEQQGSATPGAMANLMLSAFQSLSIECLAELFPMFVEAYRTTNQTVSSGISTKVVGMSAPEFDSGQWDDSNQRVNIDAPGVYVVMPRLSGYIVTQYLIAHIHVNGTPSLSLPRSGHAQAFPLAIEPVLLPLSDGDTVELYGQLWNGTLLSTHAGKLGLIVFRIGDTS